MLKPLFAFAIFAFLILAGCAAVPEQSGDNGNQLANPASVNCINNSGKLEIKKDAFGGEVGYCTLPDGAVCEEWAFFRGECPKPAGMSEELCKNSGGHWGIDTSSCDAARAQGQPCDPLPLQVCQCGGIAGFRCPAGYECTDYKPNASTPDAMGVCKII